MYQYTEEQYNRLLYLLMNDSEFQMALNNFRRKVEIGRDVDYHKVNDIEDLKKEGD